MKSILLGFFLIINAFAFSQQQVLTLCDEDTMSVFTYSTSAGTAGTYFWSIDGNPPIIGSTSYSIIWGYYGSGYHTISVDFYDDAECPAEPVSITVKVELCASTTMWAPNCFTPDGDENNNVWVPVGTNVRDPYFFIVNRWGNLLFESYDLNVGWNGTYGGNECQDGVYVYVLRWRDWAGKSYQQYGHLTLLR
jgi:gliding motility-associated-like protein